jgi:hypothetical protein
VADTVEGAEDPLVAAVRMLAREGLTLRPADARWAAYEIILKAAIASRTRDWDRQQWDSECGALLISWFKKGIPDPILQYGRDSAEMLIRVSVGNRLKREARVARRERPSSDTRAYENSGDKGSAFASAPRGRRAKRPSYAEMEVTQSIHLGIERLRTEVLPAILVDKHSSKAKSEIAFDQRAAIAVGWATHEGLVRAWIDAHDPPPDEDKVAREKAKQSKAQQRVMKEVFAFLAELSRAEDPDDLRMEAAMFMRFRKSPRGLGPAK